MADKKKGYLKSTDANDALFNKVTPILFNVHRKSHKAATALPVDDGLDDVDMFKLL